MSEAAPNGIPEDEQAAPAQADLSLGQQLAAQREAKGWTIEYVASQLNLAARQIQALESENYAALPGMASVRGFVRAYAKLLKIDANPLVALIAGEQIAPNLPLEPRPKLPSAPFSDSRLSGPGQRSYSVKGILIAIVFVLLALAILGVEHFGGWPTLAESLSNQLKDMSSSSTATGSASASASQESASAGADAKPTSEVVDSPSKESTEPAAALPQVAAPLPAPTPAVDSPAVAAPAPVAPAIAAPAATTPASPPAAASAPAVPKPKLESVTQTDIAHAGGAGKKPLQLSARQDSWVEVHDGSNVVMARLLKAGETQNLEVGSSASLVIGNAAGVDVLYAGQPVPTKTDPKTNVAHISFNSLK
jgi:cytoskeleton protein RodZ